MKKILLLVVAVAVVAQVSAKRVKPESPAGVSVLKLGPVVKVFYRGEESGTVKVAIYNDKGVAVFRETMQNTTDFMRPYNLSVLPAGIYTIELTDKTGTTYRKVDHRVSPGTVVAKITRLNNRDQRYVLAVPNRGTEALTIRIFNKNRLLYERTEKVNGDFAKLYNLNRFAGRYVFEVTDAEGNSSRLVPSAN